MASGVTSIADVIVPEIFTPYVQQLTTEKSALVQSGILVVDEFLSNFLAGGGLTINVPSWRDLDNDAENVSTADATTSSPNKIQADQEIAVRLSRNSSWSSYDLTAALAGADPMNAIASRVSDYWVRRLQTAVIATLNGVIADNSAAPSGSEHVQDDLQLNISGASYNAGVTDFSAEAFLDAAQTMGDNSSEITAVVMHSVVFNRAQKNNLIDFIPDSQGVVNIPTFLGRRVVVDDGVPSSGGVYDTWLFGTGFCHLGQNSPKVPTELDRVPAAGTGGGQDILYNRVEWMIHPTGHKYAASSPHGGPSNANTTNNLANAASWQRVYQERKMIKFARLVTREA